MIADIFNRPVSIVKNPDSIAQGAFLLSAIDMGIYKDLDEAAHSVVLSTMVDYVQTSNLKSRIMICTQSTFQSLKDLS
jgi:hypothetical protein